MRRHVLSLGFLILAGAMAFGQDATPSDTAKDKQDLRQDHRDLRHDRVDRNQDVRDIRHDQKDINHDRRDLNHDRADIAHTTSVTSTMTRKTSATTVATYIRIEKASNPPGSGQTAASTMLAAVFCSAAEPARQLAETF